MALAPDSLCDLSPSGGSAYLAPRPGPRPPFTQRQRRYAAERVDPCVGRASTAARPGAPVRSQHLLPGARRAGLLRTAHRPRADWGAARVGGGVPGARLQPRRHRRLRAHGLRDIRARGGLDRQLPGRPAGRIAVRLQHAHAHPVRARPGHPYLRASAGAARPRPAGSRRFVPRRAAAGRRRRDDGLHVGVPRRLRGGHDRDRPRHARAGMVAAGAPVRASARGRRRRRGHRDRAGLSAVPPRGARAAHGADAGRRSRTTRRRRRATSRAPGACTSPPGADGSSRIRSTASSPASSSSRSRGSRSPRRRAGAPRMAIPPARAW